MLEYIRSSAQSLGVKIAFGVIILVFVFWGVGNFNDRDYSNVVAVVNGEPIVALEFEKAYHNAEEYLLRNNPGLTREDLAKQHLGRQVLRGLIQDTLLSQEAARAGAHVSPREMRLAVEEIKAFQNEQGNFDPEAYKRALAAQRMSPAQYEKNLENQLLRDKMFGIVASSAWVDPDEAKNRFNFLRERRVIDYLFIPASSFKEKVKVDDGEMRAWYDSHKADFAIPQKINVAYVKIAPEALVDKSEIADADAQAWYEANQSRYARPEQVHASHILVALPPDADEAATKAAYAKLEKAKAELAAGKAFADVADAVNEPGAAQKGGDLGWFSKGETVPEFEEAAFSLPVGKISGPIRTPFGIHLIRIEEKRAEGFAPFAEVKQEIFKNLASERGADRLHEAVDNLIEDNILMKSLAESAAKYNLKVVETGLADRKELMEKLGIKADGADALMAVPANAPLDTALEAGDSYIVARVINAEPAGTKPFDSVKAEIGAALARERTLELAMKEAESDLAKMKNETLAKAREQYPAIKNSEPLERVGMLAGYEPNHDFMEAVFAGAVNAWLQKPFALKRNDGSQGAILAYVDRIELPDSAEYEAVAKILANATRQERMEGYFELFMNQLARNAKVELLNQALVDRVAQ